MSISTNSQAHGVTQALSGFCGRFGQISATLLIGAALTMSSCGGSSDRADYNPGSAPEKTKATVVAKANAIRTLKDTSFEHSWDLQLPKRIRNGWISPELPEIIFFQVVDTYEIYAVDAFSGHTRWVTPAFDKPARLLPGASRTMSISKEGEKHIDERLWVVADDTLYSFDAVYGQIVWRWDLPFSPSTSPLAVGPHSNQRVFIGDWEGRFQTVSYEANKNFPYVLWQINLYKPVSAMPVYHDGLVYEGDHGGIMRCFKLDREEVWAYDTGAPIFGSALTRGRVLYVGNNNNTIYALNRMSGERLGALYMNGAIKRAPFAFAGEPSRIYAWVEEGGGKPSGLYAIKTQSGTVPFTDAAKHPLEVERMGVEWFVPGFDRLVGSTPEHLFVTTGDSSIISALHRETGKVMWSWNANELHKQLRDEKGRPTPSDVVFVAQYQDSTDQNRSIFTADASGRIIAYRVFGDKPGDPLTGARVVKREPAAPAPAADAEPKAEPAADQ